MSRISISDVLTEMLVRNHHEHHATELLDGLGLDPVHLVLVLIHHLVCNQKLDIADIAFLTFMDIYHMCLQIFFTVKFLLALFTFLQVGELYVLLKSSFIFTLFTAILARLSLMGFTNMLLHILRHNTAVLALVLHVHVLGHPPGLHQLAAEGAGQLARFRGWDGLSLG